MPLAGEIAAKIRLAAAASPISAAVPALRSRSTSPRHTATASEAKIALRIAAAWADVTQRDVEHVDRVGAMTWRHLRPR
jgi:hypothetical protein